MSQCDLKMLNKVQDNSLMWAKVIDKIDHLCTSKMAVLRTDNKELQEMFPILFKAYKVALEHKLIDERIDELHIDYFYKEKHCNLSPLIESLFEIFNTAYLGVSGIVTLTKNKEHFSAKNSVEHALRTYEFKDKEQEAVFFKSDNDFHYLFADFFVTAALLELLNLTFNYMKPSHQKKVEIYFSKTQEAQYIHFKIISPLVQEQYTHFIENSLGNASDKITLGINFCRVALLNIGGTISYQSILGKEVEFLIALPYPTNPS